MDEEQSGNLEAYTGDVCDLTDIGCHLSSALEVATNILLFVPRKIFEAITDGLLLMLDLICAVCGISSTVDAVLAAASVLSAPSLIWVLSLFQVKAGLQIVTCASIIRFGIRRLPIIG